MEESWEIAERCPHFKDKTCAIASQIAGRTVPIPDPRACETCMELEHAMQENHVTSSLAIASAKSKDEQARLAKQMRTHIPSEYKHGPGDELSALLHEWNWHPEKGCKCSEHAKEMNRRGIEWCEANFKTICEWMVEEGARRGYSKLLGRLGAPFFVREALGRAKEWREKLRGET